MGHPEASGLPPLPEGVTAYCASKAAVNMLATRDRIVSRGTPLKVFVIEPGLVRSNLRGLREEEVTLGGRAGDPEDSGRMILKILQGKRDADMEKLLTQDGVMPW